LFLGAILFCHVDMTGQPMTNGSLPRSTSGFGGRTTSHSLFNLAWKLQKHAALFLQRGTGIAQHERRRVSRNFKVHACIHHPFPSSYCPSISIFHAPTRV
jgi:hypothetical protein